MRRATVGILTLALLAISTGCGSMVLNVAEPKAGQLAFKNYWVFWESWDKKVTPLPAEVTLSTHTSKLVRITNIPSHPGLTVYGRIKTHGNTRYSMSSKVMIVINAQDVEDVSRGNVVRIVVVDPKKEHQTSRFVELRLSPTEDAMKRAKDIGKPLVEVVLGNREPKYFDLGARGKARPGN